MNNRPATKSADKAKKAKRLPPSADYCDEVTDEHLARIKALVPDEEVEGAKVVSGPAW